MGQLGAPQSPGQQQPEKAGVGHIGRQLGRHLPLGVNPVGGVGYLPRETPGALQVVRAVRGRGNGNGGGSGSIGCSHLYSQREGCLGQPPV